VTPLVVILFLAFVIVATAFLFGTRAFYWRFYQCLAAGAGRALVALHRRRGV